MAAERWIVFMVLIGLGAAVYIISNADEDALREYSQRVADYNEEHHETVVENALRTRRSSVNVHDLKRRAEANVEEQDSGNGRVKRSSGQGIDEEQTEEEPDHRYPEDVEDRSRRSSGQGINEEDPDHPYPEEVEERSKRSSGQGINEEDPDHPYPEEVEERSKRSSGQGINDEDPDHPYPEEVEERSKRLSGQGINKEDPENPYTEEVEERFKRSSGQGINEEDPDHLHPEEDDERSKRSSGQGVNEEDPENPYTEEVEERSKRSSGQGINEEDPDHSYPEEDEERSKRSSGQGINEEDPDHPHPEEVEERSKRSSGQGINEEDPDHPYPEEVEERSKRSSGQGINEEDPDHPYTEEDEERSKRSSGQGINEEDPDHPYPEEDEDTLHLVGSDEDIDAAEEQARMALKSSTDDNFSISSEEHTEIINLSREESLERLDGIVSQFIEDKNEREQILDDFLSDNPIALNKIKKIDTTQYMKHVKDKRDVQESLRATSDKPEIGLLLLSALKSNDDDHEKIIKLNNGIDTVLGVMNGMFADGGLSVDLPDINKTFGHGIMAGEFEASKGYFENPGTLQRTGDVAFFKKDGAVGLEVALGLKVLKAGYDHYDVKIMKIHQNGDIKVSIGQNSLKMKITLTYSPDCQLVVDYLEVDRLDGIKIDISGLGAFQSMFDMLSKWLLDNFTRDLRNIVNANLIEKARKAVAKEDVCKHFPHLLN